MNTPSVLTEAAILAQVNKVVGVIIALIGALVAAPDGTRLIFRTSANWLRIQVNRFRKPPTKIIQIGMAEESSAAGSMTVKKSGYAWTPDAPVDERIETLRAYIADVETRLNEALSALGQERADREAAVTELARSESPNVRMPPPSVLEGGGVSAFTGFRCPCRGGSFVRGDSASEHGRTLALQLRRTSRWVLERTVGAHHRLAVDDARVPLEVARLGLGGARSRKTDDHQRRSGGGGEGHRTPDESSH
ncbi:hypothetical protein GCM10022252_27580 [Streptosporangium oxazolinicum]|uniref:Uncharacterized protein n=1 Tax=Streptosporangium oxazolinicum TaxID=909287 RepID=A0ABP8AU07_9ACTN